MSDVYDEEFDPSSATRAVLRWTTEMGASTLGEAFEMLDAFEHSNDVPEILGQDDTVDEVREELAVGLDLVGADTEIARVL